MKKKSLLTAVMAAVMLCMTTVPAMAGEWIQDGVNWRYYTDKGNPVTGWLEINGSWYYFAASGVMSTGWVKVDEGWYFLHDDGTMAHDTWIDNYYVNGSGRWVKTR